MKRRPEVVVFTCNWGPYSGLETAGLQQLDYGHQVFAVRVACTGRISPGNILKALERGADGVLMVTCPEGECQHAFGRDRAQEAFETAKALLHQLGYPESSLQLASTAVGDGAGFADQVKQFVAGLNGGAKGA
jgi:coenzyme F420-reducing hydrogenase delta subunit